MKGVFFALFLQHCSKSEAISLKKKSIKKRHKLKIGDTVNDSCLLFFLPHSPYDPVEKAADGRRIIDPERHNQ